MARKPIKKVTKRGLSKAEKAKLARQMAQCAFEMKTPEKPYAHLRDVVVSIMGPYAGDGAYSDMFKLREFAKRILETAEPFMCGRVAWATQRWADEGYPKPKDRIEARRYLALVSSGPGEIFVFGTEEDPMIAEYIYINKHMGVTRDATGHMFTAQGLKDKRISRNAAVFIIQTGIHVQDEVPGIPIERLATCNINRAHRESLTVSTSVALRERWICRTKKSPLRYVDDVKESYWICRRCHDYITRLSDSRR